MAADRRPMSFSPRPWGATSRLASALRRETVAGSLLLAATVVAIVWANSGWSSTYQQVRDLRVGPSALHLDLTLGTWAADGLLAVFFFVVGLELKREFVTGDLRDPRRAALPILAAVGGMTAPALVFVLVNLSTGDGALRGWAIPTATDIAFALAVLAVVGSHLPAALRTFLLTLAVVDDLLAVTIIAIFYTADLRLAPLLLALVPLAAFAIAVQRRAAAWWLLLPLAVAVWALVHESGVHATVAGVLMGFAVPVVRRDGSDGPGMAERLEHRVRPIAAGIAVPVFAFMAAGVGVGGAAGLADAMTEPVTLGIVLGLVAGKTVGVFGTSYLMDRFTGAGLDPVLRWVDVLAVAVLAGIGFTVSLLIGELAFDDPVRADDVKIGVLVGSVVAAALASMLLWSRDRVYRRAGRDGGAGDG